MASVASNASCIFCKIIKGEIPSFKLIETAKSYSFLDIQPTADAHVLVIPKYHGAKLHNIPDDYLADILPVVKKLTKVLHLDENNTPDGEGYNVLQNNGRIARKWQYFLVPYLQWSYVALSIQTSSNNIN